MISKQNLLIPALLATILCGCVESTVTEFDKEETDKSAKPVEVPLRPAFVKAMQQRAQETKRFQQLAKSVPAKLDEWKPSKPLARGNPVEVQFLKTALIMPGQWRLSNPEVPNTDTLLCRGPERDDKTQPVLMVSLVKPAHGQKFDIAAGLAETLRGMKLTRPNWTQSEFEWGKINGRTFARAYFQGDDAGKVTFHATGWIYVATITKDGNTCLLLFTAQDIDKYADKTLPSLEDAVLSVKIP